MVLEVPADRLFDPLLELQAGLPAQLVFEFARVDGVSQMCIRDRAPLRENTPHGGLYAPGSGSGEIEAMYGGDRREGYFHVAEPVAHTPRTGYDLSLIHI